MVGYADRALLTLIEELDLRQIAAVSGQTVSPAAFHTIVDHGLGSCPLSIFVVAQDSLRLGVRTFRGRKRSIRIHQSETSPHQSSDVHTFSQSGHHSAPTLHGNRRCPLTPLPPLHPPRSPPQTATWRHPPYTAPAAHPLPLQPHPLSSDRHSRRRPACRPAPGRRV